MSRDDLTQAKLKEILHYNPDTGVFTWTFGCGNTARAGTVAGYIHKNDGYRRIYKNGHQYKVSRLAFLYMTGEWPKDQVDHINRVRDDDRWCNLRDVSQRENMANTSVSKPVPGVHWNKQEGKWRSNISVNGTYTHLGYFTPYHLAVLARWGAEENLAKGATTKEELLAPTYDDGELFLAAQTFFTEDGEYRSVA